MVTHRDTAKEALHAEKVGLLATVILALLFVAWVGEWSIERDAVMYNGLWRSPFVALSPLFEPLPGVRLFAWQVLLIALAPFALLSRGAFQSRPRELDRAIILSLASVGITFAWGLVRGGSAYFAYYQVWRWLTALLLAYVLLSVVRSPRDLALLGKLIVLAAVIRATLCIYFYWAHVRPNGYSLEYITNHDDSIIFVTALLVLACWALVKGGRAVWTITIVLFLYLAYAMVLNDRRIAWVELMLAFATLYVLMGAGPMRSRITRWAVVTTPFVLIYFVIGLNSDAAVFAPVHAIVSAGTGTDLSSLARQEEIRNLLYTLTEFGNPLFGTGWGHPYQKLTNLWSNFGSLWELADYTPHNSLLSLVVFSGLVGLFGIWGVIPLAALLGTRGYLRASAPVPRMAAMVAVGVLVVFGVHCFGDIGFSSFIACLFVGTALGTAGKVAAWGEAVAAEVPAPAPDGDKRLRASGAMPADARRAPRQRSTRGRRDLGAATQAPALQRGRSPIRRLPGA